MKERMGVSVFYERGGFMITSRLMEWMDDRTYEEAVDDIIDDYRKDGEEIEKVILRTYETVGGKRVGTIIHEWMSEKRRAQEKRWAADALEKAWKLVEEHGCSCERGSA